MFTDILKEGTATNFRVKEQVTQQGVMLLACLLAGLTYWS
jgi:hypothetical protein